MATPQPVMTSMNRRPQVGKVWDTAPATHMLTELAQHDPARFERGGDFFLTRTRKPRASSTSAIRYFLLVPLRHVSRVLLWIPHVACEIDATLTS